MHDEVYSDGVGGITANGTVVRVDLVSLSATERDANNSPKSVFRQRLIFSVEGFANSVEVMQKALQGLIDAGVVKRSQPQPIGGAALATAEQQLSAAPAEKPRPNNSANFR